jgi:hypothetical protein
MKRFVLCLTVSVLLFSGFSAFADEGMWLFNAPPKDKIKAKYNFEITQQWLDHLRLASVKPGGGSASFVSPDGLVFTNHHIGRGCIHDVSTPEKDYMKLGFYAKTREEEPKCPGMSLLNLQDITDVTKEVEGVAKPDMTDAQVGDAQRAEIAKLEKDCTDVKNNIVCNVVTLYAGGMYHLYKYKRYTDVRLVMAPEYDMAFFGGDPDNFTYPRYDLDITFLRVYENNAPAKTPNYLKFSDKPVKEGELVFVSGHPGSTGRLLTMSQLEYLRDVAYPYTLKMLDTRNKALMEFAAKSDENRRMAENQIFGVQNSLKAITGYQSGLLDKNLMATKAADEKKLRDAVMKDPEMTKQFGGAWDAIATAMKWQHDNFNRINFMTEGAVPGRLGMYARQIVRVADGVPGAQQPGMERMMGSGTPIDKDLEILGMKLQFEAMLDHMGANDPFVKTVLAGKTPEERATELVNETKLGDAAYRKELMDGGKTAVDASTDPLIVLIREIDPQARAIRKEVDDKAASVIRRNSTLIAKARFKVYGTSFAPDATGTLRLSYGVHKSYMENGKKINYFTTMGQAFDYAAKHGNKEPYKLPESWMNAKNAINPKTQFDSVNTSDIIGGNSGSPAVNKNLEIVGIIFDGNIQSLPMNYLYEDVVGRAVITNSTAVLEALRKIYNANALADEVLGKTPAASQKPAEKKAAGE